MSISSETLNRSNRHCSGTCAPVIRESLIVDTVDLDVTAAQDFGNARVRAPNGCASILNRSLHTLVEPAQSTRGGGEGEGDILGQ
jgi:hypothetical protein